MEALIEYVLFLAKSITILVALIFIISVVVSAAAHRVRPERKGDIVVEKLNERFDTYKDILSHEVLSKEDYKKQTKAQKAKDKKTARSKKAVAREKKESSKRIYVVNFEGDIRVSSGEELSHEVSAILTLARPEDEVLVKVESAGGMVHAYGLAASQLDRIRKKGIPLTIAIDKIAASGGYMMAAIAHKIIAAPFAIVGSIGVVAQLPNFHKFLQKHDVDVELHTAGEFKRTLTLFGENTQEGRQKFLEELEDTHALFKEFVEAHRPQVNIAEVATGEHWFASRALKLNLVDEIITSDEYLMNQAKNADIFSVKYEIKKSMAEKVGLQVRILLNTFMKGTLKKTFF